MNLSLLIPIISEGYKFFSFVITSCHNLLEPSTAHHSCFQNKSQISASMVWSQPWASSLDPVLRPLFVQVRQRQPVSTPTMLFLAWALLHGGFTCLRHLFPSLIQVLPDCNFRTLARIHFSWQPYSRSLHKVPIVFWECSRETQISYFNIFNKLSG